MKGGLTFKPLSASTWKDFEKLFGPRGACGGCWCMTWRLSKSEFESSKGDGNKDLMKNLVRAREPIGIIGFKDDNPVAWCAVAPREKYKRLEKSRALKPIDEKKVWSISCFFIAKPYRRQGLSVKLLEATIAYAKDLGANIVEAYPIETKNKTTPDVFAWTGILSSFEKAGFKEMPRNSAARPIVRFYLK